METSRIDDLGSRQCADFLVSSTARLRAEGARQLIGLAQWAAIHGPESLVEERGASGRLLPGTEQCRGVGGDGTPEVAEFAIDEVGVYLGLPTLTAQNLLGDVLDLQHRHPLLWARVLEAAQCDAPGADPALAVAHPQAWQATWVARRCRNAGLSEQAARWVDARCAHKLGSLSWTAFQTEVDRLVLRADPALAEEKRRRREAERQVFSTRTNADGLKRLVLQGSAAEVIVDRARIHQLALILRDRGAAAPMRQLEADAASLLLTNPAEATLLLCQAAAGDPDTEAELAAALADRLPDPREGGPAPGACPVPDAASDDTDLLDDLDLLEPEPVDPRTGPEAEPGPSSGSLPGAHDPRPGSPVEEPCLRCGRATPPPGEGSASGPPGLPAGLDPARLRPALKLYLHCTPADLLADERPDGSGAVVTCEQTGPMTRAEAIALIGHAHVTIQPVLDLNRVPASDAYRPSPTLADAVRLANPTTVFPYASASSRSAHTDLDHPVPYRPGFPGQTRLDNLAPLTRRNHRTKTFARGWSNAQPTAGVHAWRTRHGYAYLVDADGTVPQGRMTSDCFHRLVGDLALRGLDLMLDDEERRLLAEELAAEEAGCLEL